MATEDDSTVVASRWGGIIELQPQQLIRVAILGLVTGIVAWLVTLFMQDVVLSALSCGEATGVRVLRRGCVRHDGAVAPAPRTRSPTLLASPRAGSRAARVARG